MLQKELEREWDSSHSNLSSPVVLCGHGQEPFPLCFHLYSEDQCFPKCEACAHNMALNSISSRTEQVIVFGFPLALSF